MVVMDTDQRITGPDTPHNATAPAGADVPDFLRVLKNSVHFASHHPMLSMLNAVKISWRDKRIYAQATDRYRVYSEWVVMRPATDQDEMRAEGDAVIPLDDVKKLIKRLASCERSERVELSITDTKLMVTTVACGPTRERLDVTATYPMPRLDSDVINAEKFLGLVDWSSDQPVPPKYCFAKDFMADLWKIESPTKNAPITFSFNGPKKPVGFRIDDGEAGGIEGILMQISRAT
jgi:DNA polymerase III beta subunit, central domain